jgi:hypothetical protein
VALNLHFIFEIQRYLDNVSDIDFRSAILSARSIPGRAQVLERTLFVSRPNNANEQSSLGDWVITHANTLSHRRLKPSERKLGKFGPSDCTE